MEWPVVLYVANLIDYLRVVFLWLAYREYEGGDGFMFAVWYVLSYLLDAFDGMAARALGQTSKLGYYLDMIIDRMSSMLCLHLAAQQVLVDFPSPFGSALAGFLYACLIMVEFVAHGVVMYQAEMGSFHQKEMESESKIVSLYLQSKPVLFSSCVAYEAAAILLVMGEPLYSLAFAPGFLFRAVANLMRLNGVLRSPKSASQTKTD